MLAQKSKKSSFEGGVTKTSFSSKLFSLLMALVLAASMVSIMPAQQAYAAFQGPETSAYNADDATGDSDDPFKILVTSMTNDYTMPSAFWSGTGLRQVDGNDDIIPFAVSFEQREGNTTEGSLISSMTFDMHTGLHEGIPTLGYLIDDSSVVWDIENPTWTYAFRLSPYSAQDTSTGDLRIGFSWHGCFATYFDSWDYAFDAVSATAGLSEDKQIKPGDTITMSYYGGYVVGQTSRGTAYSVDFNNLETDNEYSGKTVLGDPADAVYEAVVGEDGYAHFNGANSIQYGGNYAVAIKERAPEPRPEYTGAQGTCKITLSGFDSITTEEGTTNNYIESKIDATAPFEFTLGMQGPGYGWGASRYPGGTVESWLDTYVYPYVSVVDSEGAVVASYEKGNLSCTSYDETRPCTNFSFAISANTFEQGKSYKLVLGSAMCGPNTNSPSGVEITFAFTTSAAGEANKNALNRTINQAKADISTVKVSEDGSDVLNIEVWVTAAQMQAINDAIAAASAVSADAAATQEQVDEAAAALTEAWDAFKSQKQPGTMIGVVQQWNIGAEVETDAIATLYTDGKLVISGTGNLATYTSNGLVPWAAKRSEIKSVAFEGDVAPTNLDCYFQGCTNLTSVEGIPEGVKSMRYTFSQCTSLVTAPKLPDSVEDLYSTFSYCYALESIDAIPASATNLTFTFMYCSALKACPAIPDSVGDMSQTFWNTTSLESIVNLPASTKSYSYTFQNATALTSCPDIPEGTTHLIGMFDGCTALQKAPAIPEGVRMLFNAFRGCTSLSEIGVIPSTVTNATRAFQNCTSLTTLPDGFAIPESVSSDLTIFAVDGAEPLEMRVTAPADESVLSYDWASNNRTLIVLASEEQIVELGDSVTVAEGSLAGVEESSDGSDVFSNEEWVTPAVMQALEEAVANAQAVLADANATSDEVDAAAQTLADALAWFVPAPGLKALSKDVVSLNALAAVGRSAAAGVVASNAADGSDVPFGTAWVSASALDALNAALEASAAVAGENPQQADVDAAYLALADALAGFAPQGGTQASETSVAELASAASAAKIAAASVAVSADGSDVPQDDLWVTPDAIDALNQAIANAQAAVAAENPQASDVNAAAKALAEALIAFDPQPGTKALSADVEELDSAIAAAKTMTEGVSVSEDGSDVAFDKAWVTPEAAAALAAAIAQAEGAIAPKNPQAEDVAAAQAALSEAAADYVPASGTHGRWVSGWNGWWFEHADGSWTANGWELIDGAWYLFDGSGWMLSGWQKWNGSWYYLGSADDGAMKTGWVSWNGSWYYLSGSGAMLTGWFQDATGTWYCADASGAMLSDCWVGDYYLTGSGAMATSQWVGPYWVGADGRWVASA